METVSSGPTWSVPATAVYPMNEESDGTAAVERQALAGSLFSTALGDFDNNGNGVFTSSEEVGLFGGHAAKFDGNHMLGLWYTALGLLDPGTRCMNWAVWYKYLGVSSAGPLVAMHNGGNSQMASNGKGFASNIMNDRALDLACGGGTRRPQYGDGYTISTTAWNLLGGSLDRDNGEMHAHINASYKQKTTDISADAGPPLVSYSLDNHGLQVGGNWWWSGGVHVNGYLEQLVFWVGTDTLDRIWSAEEWATLWGGGPASNPYQYTA